MHVLRTVVPVILLLLSVATVSAQTVSTSTTTSITPPTCTIKYYRTVIPYGGSLLVSWDAQNTQSSLYSATRTTSIYGSMGTLVSGTQVIPIRGQYSSSSYIALKPGSYIRKDIVNAVTGTATCQQSLQIIEPRPSCTVSLSPSTITQGGTTTASLTSADAQTRTYRVTDQSGKVVIGSTAVPTSGKQIMDNLRTLLPGQYKRTDVVSGKGGTTTCQTILNISANPAKAEYLGVHYDFLWERKGTSTAEKAADLQSLVSSIKDLGVKSVRMPIRWMALYDTPTVACVSQTLKTNVRDSYREILNALPSDVTVVAYLDTPPTSCNTLYKTDPAAFSKKYKEYVTTVVKEFDDRIHHWEIWNEQNNYPFAMKKQDGTMWSGGEYVTYALKPGYEAVKSIAPNDKVIFGGLSENGIIAHGGTAPTSGSVWYLKPGFLEGVYVAGGKQYFDIMAIHPYINMANPASLGIGPNTDYKQGKNGEYLVPSMDQVTKSGQLIDLMKKYGDEKKEIWWTEFGVTTGAAGSEMTQATTTLESIRSAWTRRASSTAPVTKVFLYTLRNNYDAWQDYGLIRENNSTKPLYVTVKDFIRGATYATADQLHILTSLQNILKELQVKLR